MRIGISLPPIHRNVEKCGQSTTLLTAIQRLGDEPGYRLFHCEACNVLQWVAAKIVGGTSLLSQDCSSSHGSCAGAGALLLILRVSSIVPVSPERYPLQKNSCSRSLLSHNRISALTVTYGPVSAALAVVASSRQQSSTARYIVIPH